MYFLLFLVIFSLKLSNCQAENDMKPSLDDLFMSPKLIEAKKYSITCQLSNGKQSNVWFEWFVNGKRIQSNENITINQVDDISLLTIRSMSSDYNGEYTCKARNGHLQESKSISIKLNVKPRWAVKPINISTRLNSILSTKCEAIATPSPVIRWQRISPNGEIQRTVESDELKLNFTKSDSGDWKCIASNSLGSIEETISINYYDELIRVSSKSYLRSIMYLVVILAFLSSIRSIELNEEKPLIQEIMLPRAIQEGQTVRLNCALIQGGSVNFEWFFNGEKLKENAKRRIKLSDDSSELIIKQVSVDEVGDYRCSASNRNGKDAQRVALLVNVKPRFVKEPQDVTSSLLTEVKLECDVKAYPAPTVRWSKLSLDKKTVAKEFKTNVISFELVRDSVGVYKCSASNSIGSIEKTISVGYFEYNRSINGEYLQRNGNTVLRSR